MSFSNHPTIVQDASSVVKVSPPGSPSTQMTSRTSESFREEGHGSWSDDFETNDGDDDTEASKRAVYPPSDSSTCSEAFQHPPLADPKNEIRLLRLQAGTGDEEIGCKLLVCDMTDLPNYDAISYTWGDTRGTRFVRIDGKVFAVGENCWLALQQVRLSHVSRLVWIDAISINQQDRSEKNHQVQEMARVFQNASRVLVSLGTDADDADFLFEWVDELFFQSEHPEPRFRRKHRGESWGDLDSKWPGRRGEREDTGVGPARDWVLNWFDKIEPDGFERFARSLTQLGRHPYWQRMWVQPELAFARDAFLFYGAHVSRISIIKIVFFALDGFAAERSEMSTRYSVSETARNINTLVALPMKATLDKLSTGHLNKTRKFFGGFQFQELCKLRCSEPRDRIFAIIPLVDWQGFGLPTLTVDYERSGFSLAQECIPFCTDLWDVKFLLKCLEVGCEHTEADVSSFIDRRTSLFLMQTPSLSSVGVCECGTIQVDNLMFFYAFCYFRIRKGRLKKTSRGCKVVEDRCAGKDAPRTPGVIAYVPKATRADDILLSLPIGQSGSACEGLVIRKDHRGIYEFVGQAVLDSAYSQQHYSHYPSGFELRLSPEDLLAFAMHGSSPAECCQESVQSGLFHRFEIPFTRSRFSSYAVEYRSTSRGRDPWRRDYVDYRELNKTKNIICTSCGGYPPSSRSADPGTEHSLSNLNDHHSPRSDSPELFPRSAGTNSPKGHPSPKMSFAARRLDEKHGDIVTKQNVRLDQVEVIEVDQTLTSSGSKQFEPNIRARRQGFVPPHRQHVIASNRPDRQDVDGDNQNSSSPESKHSVPSVKAEDKGFVPRHRKDVKVVNRNDVRAKDVSDSPSPGTRSKASFATRRSNREDGATNLQQEELRVRKHAESERERRSPGWSKYSVTSAPTGPDGVADIPSVYRADEVQFATDTRNADDSPNLGSYATIHRFSRDDTTSPGAAKESEGYVKRATLVVKSTHFRSSSAGVVETIQSNDVRNVSNDSTLDEAGPGQLGRPKARSFLGPITDKLSRDRIARRSASGLTSFLGVRKSGTSSTTPSSPGPHVTGTKDSYSRVTTPANSDLGWLNLGLNDSQGRT